MTAGHLRPDAGEAPRADTVREAGIGVRGQYEASLEGCIDNQDVVIGRGWLPAEQFVLRLERTGDFVHALCSADDEQWYSVGEVEFVADDSLQVGLYAISNIDRTIYHGAFPEGTAIRFTEFRLHTA